MSFVPVYAIFSALRRNFPDVGGESAHCLRVFAKNFLIGDVFLPYLFHIFTLCTTTTNMIAELHVKLCMKWEYKVCVFSRLWNRRLSCLCVPLITPESLLCFSSV